MRLVKVVAVIGMLLGLTTTGLAQAATPSSRYVALLIQSTGGYSPSDYVFSRTPTVLYSDGTLIVPSRIQTAQFPGQFVVSTFMQKTEFSAVARILAAANKVNVTDPKFDWGWTGIVDVPDTVFVSQASPRAPQVKVSVYALGFDSDARPLEKLYARRAATKFVSKVEAFSPEFMWTKSRPTVWKPTKWLYMAVESKTDEFTNTHKWFGSKPLQWTGTCQQMTSAENLKFNALLPKLNSASRFSSDGRIWRITVRPLFPHETGCQSLIN